MSEAPIGMKKYLEIDNFSASRFPTTQSKIKFISKFHYRGFQ